MNVDEKSMPRWDLERFFAAPDSPEFEQALAALVREIEALTDLQAARGVRRRTESAVDGAFVAAYEEITCAWNALQEHQRLLAAYLGCLTSTDARDENSRARQSQLNMQSVSIDKLYTRYAAWVGTSDIESLAAQSPMARAHEYLLQKMKQQAAHQMSEGEEELASDLRTSGLTGWARLHDNVSALLEVRVALPEGEQVLPMSSVRALANLRIAA